MFTLETPLYLMFSTEECKCGFSCNDFCSNTVLMQGRTQDFLKGFPQVVDPRRGDLGVQPPLADKLNIIAF